MTNPPTSSKGKQKIIYAARSLFLTEGYKNVSMRKIAKEVGCSATNIYNYFRNKEELVLCLLKEGYKLFLQHLEQSIDSPSQDVMKRIQKMMVAYIHFSIQYPDYYQLFFVHNLEGADTVIIPESDRLKGLFLLRELVQEAIEQKYFPKKDPTQMTQALWAHVHGISSLLITFPNFPWAEKEALIDHYIATYLNGLRASVS